MGDKIKISGKLDTSLVGKKIYMAVEYIEQNIITTPVLLDGLEFSFILNNEEHVNAGVAADWASEIAVYLYHEDEDGIIDYINEYAYDWTGNIMLCSGGFLVSGYMFLYPYNDKLHIYNKLIPEGIVERLDRAMKLQERNNKTQEKIKKEF